MDELKEKLVEKFKQNVYPRSAIDKMTLVIGFDLWKGMIWCDYDIWQKEDWKTSIGLKYRLIGFEDIVGKKEQKQILLHINYRDFYSITDIQNVATVLGFQIYSYCHWESYTEIIRDNANENLHYHYFRKLRSENFLKIFRNLLQPLHSFRSSINNVSNFCRQKIM